MRINIRYTRDTLRRFTVDTLRALLWVATLAGWQAVGAAQQVADSTFAPRVENPAYTTHHPRIAIDEGHNNFHTASGRYQPFAELLTQDGCRVSAYPGAFTPARLGDVDVLVISNALGGTNENDPDSILATPAFTDEEVQVVAEWVEGGGALLLMADHAPCGAAAQRLANAFGVEMRNTWTYDEDNAEPGQGRYNLAFSRANELLGVHPITAGRNSGERIEKVVAFTGQSLLGPAGSTSLLKLADSAMDEDVTETVKLSAAGRSQGVALRFGAGRVVVLGEASMLTAQQRVRDGRVRRFGLSYPHCDNVQFALNVVHWLTGLLDE